VIGRPNPFSEEEDDLRGRHVYLASALVVLVSLLILRMWYLQVVQGDELRTLSESNRTRVQDMTPVRGQITDRNGVVLANNIPTYELLVVPADVPDPKQLAGQLAFYLNRPYNDILKALETARPQFRNQPVHLLAGLSRAELVTLETHRYELPGIVLDVEPRRQYLHDGLASHIIGYLGQVNEKQLKQDEYREHRMGDLAGQTGVERGWEAELHGKRGRRLVEVDAAGRLLKVLGESPPEHGYNLELTLDARLQRLCQQALGAQAGAVVVLDPSNGEVLALASMPTFSQMEFINGISDQRWKDLQKDPLHPMENRAVTGRYPPGSTFKIVTATAALEEGVVGLRDLVTCSGGFEFGNRVFHCWNAYGHGGVNMHRAIKESCDIYFYEMGLRVGVDRLSDYARAFGLGQKAGLGLPNEREGLFPTKAWKQRVFKSPWRAGETLSVAIGQGYIQTTPLQMAQVTAVAANGGTLYQSHLVRRITDSEGRVVREYGPEVVRNLNLKPETVDAIRQGLSAVINEPGGTAPVARLDSVLVAGKTGTAQVVGLGRDRIRLHPNWWQYKDHAWFVAFAPVKDPKIAVAVVIEHGGHGGSAAAPIAREVIRAFFDPTIDNIRPSPLPKPNPVQDEED
jgi:penicillin-binding protein 2